MRMYFSDQKNKDIALKIFKKKISYEGIPDTYRRSKRFLAKKKRKEQKRIKKHAFRTHIRFISK